MKRVLQIAHKCMIYSKKYICKKCQHDKNQISIYTHISNPSIDFSPLVVFCILYAYPNFA